MQTQADPMGRPTNQPSGAIAVGEKVYEVYGLSILSGKFCLLISTDNQDLAVEVYREYINSGRNPRLYECFDDISIVI
jgi:hypothetical protein